jgi:hypothetical protein
MTPPTCLYCARDETQTPLIQVAFNGSLYWICPQHLPLLIHKPEQLVDKLPGLAATLPKAD